MTEAQARFIMSEIHRIDNYDKLIREYGGELVRIRQKLDDLQSLPSSGNMDKIRNDNHIEISTLINILLSDEKDYLECLNKAKERKDIALSYKRQIIAQTDADAFMLDYINQMSYRKLTHVHGWENPYEHMISVMRKLDIRI